MLRYFLKEVTGQKELPSDILSKGPLSKRERELMSDPNTKSLDILSEGSVKHILRFVHV